ncbi:MAG TPA: hypothetical protein VNZ54_10245 [bacterium]|nr:hypothetical protein [bacterium]
MGPLKRPKPKSPAAPAAAAAAKPAAQAPVPAAAKPAFKPPLRPAFRRERKPSVRRFPKLALHRHPTSVSYGPDEWRVVLDALPLVQQWVRERGAGGEIRPMDLQIAAVVVWDSEELDHWVLNLKREPVQLAFGLAKAGLIVERAAEVEAWLRKQAA